MLQSVAVLFSIPSDEQPSLEQVKVFKKSQQYSLQPWCSQACMMFSSIQFELQNSEEIPQ